MLLCEPTTCWSTKSDALVAVSNPRITLGWLVVCHGMSICTCAMNPCLGYPSYLADLS